MDVVSAASSAAEKPAATTAKPQVKAEKPAATTAKPAATKPAAAEAEAEAPQASEVQAPVPTKTDSLYRDGIYVAYGNAYSKGTEGARVTIRNGVAAGVELLRTTPTLIDRDARYNYGGLWQAYETMKSRLIGKTREEAAAVDTVSGATRSSDGWKLAVDRAFVRAMSTKPADRTYFEGEHMGVDPEGKFMVFARYDATRLTGVKVYPVVKGSAVEEKAMTADQAKLANVIANELLYRGAAAKASAGYESDFAAAVKAFEDAEKNALVDYGAKYVDGFYSAYGEARDKGVERADIVVRNGKLVDVKLYRLGANLIDRGDTAYADVVAAKAPMAAKLLANGSYIENYTDADAISGATESSLSWNVAVERAFQKALKQPLAASTFDGTFAGVDNRSEVLLLVGRSGDKTVSVSAHLFGSDGKLIKADALSGAQRTFVAAIGEALTAKGVAAEPIAGFEALSAAAKAAYADALSNASTKQGNYKDGTFTAYGDAYDKGTNQANVTLRNGNIVALGLYRVGVNMVDRGATAYAEVVKAIPELTEQFLAGATRKNAREVDAVTGATSSSAAFKTAVERAYKKAEILEPYKTAYFNGIHAGTDSGKTVYVMATVEKNVPVKFQVYFLDENGKIKADDALTEAELAVRAELQQEPAAGEMHKYAYRPAAFGETEEVKGVSAKAVEAIKAALEAGGV
ncbi:FMN-binding protein [Paenibacillus sp. TRM 82003]|nr:FMN-binding protein [Paenibacillus sp. TRM 82003]